MEDKRKQMSELSLVEMKKAAGGNKAEADAFVKELFQKYGVTNEDELNKVVSYEDRCKYTDILIKW